MTQRDVKRVLDGWQERLGLRHWNIKLDYKEPALPGSVATVNKSNDYNDARIRFRRDWKGWDAWFLNYTLVHELLHLVFRDLDWVHDRAEVRVPGEDLRELLGELYDHECEGVVDRLAEILVNLGGVIR